MRWEEKLVKYRVLGPLELHAAGEPVQLEGERQRKLLGLLLLDANTAVPHDRLVDELWERPPRTARRQVSNAAASVRRALGQRLVTTPHGYLVRVEEDRLDLAVFRGLVRDAAAQPPVVASRLLREALDLWRGPLLAGLDSPAIAAARSGLAEERLAALERHAELAPARSVIGELVPHVAEHPLRESLRAVLVRALHRAGREADALEVFEEGRSLLAEWLGVDPGPELRAAHEAVLRSGSPRKSPAPPRSFLPPDTADFTGRDDDVARVLELTAHPPPGGPVVVVLEGMGGIGKTSLAVHVAHRLRDRFPDGAHFLDLRGFTGDGKPVPVDVALDALLWQAGVPADRVAADPVARRDQWRSLTAGLRVLVLLDNAADAAQVRDLLPGAAGSVVLVTSRRHLVELDGAVPVPLDVLALDAAVELFRRVASPERVDPEPAALASVVRLCGRLPLAVRLAAARFRRHPRWTVEHLASQLRKRSGRDRLFSVGDGGVAGAVLLSYNDLSSSCQRIFRLLSVVPGLDFDVCAAAAVGGIRLDRAEEETGALFERSLLLERGPGRYAFHDLVRDFAGERAAAEDGDNEVEAARRRLFDHYVEFAAAHCVPIRGAYPMPGPVPAASLTPEEAVAGLRAEHANLVAAADHASTHGWWGHAWRLPCLLLPYFTRIGRRIGVDVLAGHALHAARQLGDPRAEAYASITAAFALDEQGHDDEVRELLERAVRLSASGDPTTAAAARRGLGEFALREGRLEEAACEFAAARDLARSGSDAAAETSATNDLARALTRLGRYAEARELFEIALRHHRAAGTKGGEAAVLINLAWLHRLHGEVEDGLKALVTALRLSRAAGYVRAEVMSLAAIAVAQRRLGRVDEAVTAGRAAVAAAEAADLSAAECAGLNGLGEAYLAAGRLDDAEVVFHRAERIALTGNLSEDLARAWEGLAHVAVTRGDDERARRLWTRAVSTYPEFTDDAAPARSHLSDVSDPLIRCLRCESHPAEVRPIAR